MIKSLRSCAVLATLLAMVLARPTTALADDGLPFEKDPMGTVAVEGDKAVLQVGAVTYEVTNEDPAAVLKNFPGSSALLYGQATKVTDTRYKLLVQWMYCPEGDVYDDPSVSLVPRGKVPAGKVALLFSAQDPDTKVWWVRIAYEGGPLVSNQESWVKADLLFKKPQVVDVAAVTTRSFDKNPKGTIAVEDGKTVLKSGDVTYEISNEDPAAVLKNFPGSTIALQGKATRLGDKRFSLDVAWAQTPAGDVYDDPSVSQVPRGTVPAGKVRLLFAAQDPDTKVWWVRIAYEGGPLVANQESWVKGDLLFGKPAAAAAPSKTDGLDGAVGRASGAHR